MIKSFRLFVFVSVFRKIVGRLFVGFGYGFELACKGSDDRQFSSWSKIVETDTHELLTSKCKTESVPRLRSIFQNNWYVMP